MLITQVIINGIILGSFYGVIAVGFTLVWGVMNIINVAHGTALMIGAYISFFALVFLGLDPFLSLPISFLILFTAGFILQKYVINLIIKAPIFMTFLVTFGISLIFENLALSFFGAEYRSAIPEYAGAGFAIGGLVIPYVRIGVLLISWLLIIVLNLFLEKTMTGLAIRATRMNRDAAKLMGVNIGKIYGITFGIGIGLAGAAGSLMSTSFMVGTNMGGGFLLRAFVVAILGGMGNMNGALVGGLVFGLVEALGSVFLGPGYQESIGMGVMVMVLAIRPSGIMGKRFYEI